MTDDVECLVHELCDYSHILPSGPLALLSLFWEMRVFVFLLLICRCLVGILGVFLCSHNFAAIIFFPSLWLAYVFFNDVFWWANVLNFEEAQSINFVFMISTLSQGNEDILLLSSSGNFMILVSYLHLWPTQINAYKWNENWITVHFQSSKQHLFKMSWPSI